MKLFCIALSLILVMAKIFGLITLGWFGCLAPIIIYFIANIIMGIAIVIGAVFACKVDNEETED